MATKINLSNFVEVNHCFDDDRLNNNKIAPSPQPSTNLRGETNPYIRFGYGPMKIF